MAESAKVLQFDCSYDFYVKKGSQCINDKKYLKALRYFFAALKKKPDDISALLHVAVTYQKMDLIEESNCALFKTLALDPDNEGASALLGQNYSILGDGLRELFYLRNIARFVEDDELLEFFDDPSSVIPHYEQIYPMPQHAYEAIASRSAKLLAQGDVERAREGFEEILKSRPDDVFARNNICRILMLDGKIAQAIDVAKEILRKEPKNVFAWCNLAMALHFAGNEQQRDDAIDILLQTAEDSDDVKSVVKILILANRHADACKWAQKHLAAHPYDVETMAFAAVAAYNSGDFGKAKEHFATLNAIFPETQSLRYFARAAQKACDGEPVIGFFSYDLSLPLEEKQAIARKISKIDFEKMKGDAQAESLAAWAFRNENLMQADFIFDNLIAADKEHAKREMCNLVAQNVGWTMKRLALFKLIVKCGMDEIYINKDGYFMQLDMPQKPPPKGLEKAFWWAFATLSVFFIDQDDWIDSLLFSASLIETGAEKLAAAKATDEQLAALMARLARIRNVEDRHICKMFNVSYGRLVKLTAALYE